MTKAAPAIHLICGSTGAGKTTYAIRLADEIGGVRFSIDAWMTALFWMDAPQPIDPGWAIARVERCAALIWRTAAEIAACGTLCLLEIGLTTRASRAHYAALAAAAGLPLRLHWLDVDPTERWRRVEARNAHLGDLDFAITRAMFDFVERMWEAPDTDELAAHDGVRIAG